MRQLLYFLPLLLLLMPAAPVAAQDDCTTEACPTSINCTGCDPNTFIIDPEDCHKFYICDDQENPTPESFPCDAGQVFNASGHACQDGTECEECVGGFCSYECPESGPGFQSDKTDCSLYYECSDGAATERVTCDDPDKPFFNGVECQADAAACCSCKAYCTEDDAYHSIADPADCRKFHYCLEEGWETIPGMCEDGEYWDNVIGGCFADADCEPACRNVVGSDGCIDPFTCLTEGYFAACPGNCTAAYYHCTSATGEYQDVQTCSSGVFHPDDHTCVDPGDCP